MASMLEILKDARKKMKGKAPALPKELPPEKAADEIGGYVKELGVDPIKENIKRRKQALKELED